MLPEGIWGSGGIRSLILNRGFALGHFTPTEGTLVPLRLGACVGPGAGLNFFFLEEKPFTPPGMEEVFLDSLSRSLVSVMYSAFSTA